MAARYDHVGTAALGCPGERSSAGSAFLSSFCDLEFGKNFYTVPESQVCRTISEIQENQASHEYARLASTLRPQGEEAVGTQGPSVESDDVPIGTFKPICECRSASHSSQFDILPLMAKNCAIDINLCLQS